MTWLTASRSMSELADFDYSRSHRDVPIPVTTSSSTAQRAVQSHDAGEAGVAPAAAHHQTAALSPLPPSSTAAPSGESTERRRRRGSFSFRRRAGSTSSQASSVVQTAASNAPPVPTTRIAQAYVETAAAAGANQPKQHSSQPSLTGSVISRKGSSEPEGRKMLRKASKTRAEQEQRQREAALAARPPPSLHLPSLHDADDERPDSFGIFDKHYRNPSPSHPVTANFSRPGNAAMPSSTYNTSSSPAYAIRSGNAFAQQAALSTSSPLTSSVPPGVAQSTNGEHDGERTESMANRGRYSYASNNAQFNSNSPRRVRRRKDPTPFNILVVGAKNCGKTSFISFLRHSFSNSGNKQPHDTANVGEAQTDATKTFTSEYLETEMDGERVGVTLWDSAGLEKHIIDLQLREMATFVESKFEETFVEEQKVMRSPGVKDTHIHCVFLVLDPVRLDTSIAGAGNIEGAVTRGGLDDEMDLQVIRALWGKTTVIPVISKADTLTVGHMAFLKRAVWNSLKASKLDPLEALDLEGDEELDENDAIEEDDEDGDRNEESDYERFDRDEDVAPRRNGHNRQSSLAVAASNPTNADEPPYIPMSILSPDIYDLPPFTKSTKSGKIGRRFPWGFADPYDPDHCDFVRLRDSIFSEWRGDLRDLARTKWYENWRTSRLKNLPGQARQRVKGGITPTAAVPKEGRTSPRETRNVSGVSVAQSVGGASGGMPRSVSANTGPTAWTGTGAHSDRGASKAERMMGIGSDAQSMSSRTGTYRSADNYQ